MTWSRATTILVAVAVLAAIAAPAAAKTLTAEDVLSLRYAASAVISPDGRYIACTVSVPRDIDDKPGGRYSELYVVDVRSRAPRDLRPFITGKVNVSGVEWSPDGSQIGFRMKRGDGAHTQVWAIPIDGGEARALTHSKENVLAFHWHPEGDHIAYIATEPKSKRTKTLAKKGYGFTYYEEELRHRVLYMERIDDDGDGAEALTDGITLWSFVFSPDGTHIAAGASEKNLIDSRYAFQQVYLIDVATREMTKCVNNPGKLGNIAFSPDGSRLAWTAALSRGDHAVSQVLVRSLDGGDAVNLTEPDFAGHVTWCGWKDDDTVVYRASEGVWETLSTVKADGGKRKVILDCEDYGVNLYTAPLTYTGDFRHFAFNGSSPEVPADVYYWRGKGEPERMTDLNPWLSERDLGRAEVYRHTARDGYEVEGLLYYPVGYEPGRRYPLVVAVHGGPESHHSWSWRTSYSRPVEVLTGEGYLVFLPNYRASTGYGLAHIADHMGDPAGVEFDDVADGIKSLVDAGLADPQRVGLGGGSYGGYAAAWFSTYYTDLVKATIMFVGISDLISKRSTTDIPYEELYVHSGQLLEDMWQRSLERSPIYYAHQSKTATLIIGGEADTRVHPSQSLELYRRMKMNGHPAVRLVRYPGEGHGNRKMPGRRDVLYRTVQWYNWFVRDGKPLDGGMPDVDISDMYPLDLGGEKEAAEEKEALP
jgi:dipeptidyl aminopeptidase/acylaminoacyl peptidase